MTPLDDGMISPDYYDIETGANLSSKRASVAVVMSTYNGAEYLHDQIESVLAQDVTAAADLYIYARDDGSKDSTVEILAEYASRGQLEFERGNNLGVVGSFLELIERVPSSMDYIALCDQDDVWHADKLSRALEVLSGRDQTIPQLYCSEYVFCDSTMTPQGRSHLNRNGVNFQKMLYENMVSGNTTVINRQLANVIVRAGRDGVYCHDWWLALVASALGELTYDDYASLDYRRTGANASPTGASALNLFRYRIKTFFKKGQFADITRQLQKLDDCFGECMPSQKRDLLRRFLCGSQAAKAFTPVRLRQKTSEELALRLLFLMGRL